jgi:arginine/lysine/ornithine decarboxylase
VADVESCVRTLKEDEGIIDRVIRLNNMLKESVSKFPAITMGEFENFEADPCKTIIKIPGLSGHELSDILDVMRINIEKSTPKCIVIITHINILKDDVGQLITAIVAIAKEFGITEGDQAMRGKEPEQLNPI